jgi:hypothetical protein
VHPRYRGVLPTVQASARTSGSIVIFKCPRCGQEVRSELDVADLRLELRRKRGTQYERVLTTSLGKVCMRCGRSEVESRRPARAPTSEPLRLEGL